MKRTLVALAKGPIVRSLQLLNRIVPQDGIPILEYHRVSPNIGGDHVHSILPNEFSWQMEWLADHGYRVIGLGEAVDRLERGDWEKSVALTFDDGHRDILQYAMPVLAKFKARATVFIVTDYVGKSGWMTWEGELRADAGCQRWELMSWEELRQGAGVFDFGVHGKTHRALTDLRESEIAADLEEARSAIARNLGVRPEFYCYPWGKADGRSAAAVCRAGFRGACGTRKGLNKSDTDRYQLLRNEVGQGLTPAQFSLLLSEYVRTYSYIGSRLRQS